MFKDITLWPIHDLLRPLITSNFMLTCHRYQTTCTFPFIAGLISGSPGRLFICHRIFEAITLHVYTAF